MHEQLLAHDPRPHAHTRDPVQTDLLPELPSARLAGTSATRAWQAKVVTGLTVAVYVVALLDLQILGRLILSRI